ncbi:MAG TPA: YidB family protein [Stellaceae bacterium]
MGFLDTVLSELPQEHTSSSSSGVPAALASLLQGGEGGALQNLAERFKSAGLGQAFDSWLSNEPNQPVAPDDVHRALGENQVQTMAAQAGMSKTELLPLLAQYLPRIVDRLSPQGQMPESGGAAA